MARHRIICVREETVHEPIDHVHIVKIGTGSDPDAPERHWTVEKAIGAAEQGEGFYTRGLASGKIATVLVASCPHCGQPILQSSAEAVPDNDLSSLRLCADR